MDINNIVTSKLENISQSRQSNAKAQTEHVSSESVKTEEKIARPSKENIDNLVDALNSAAKSVNQRVQFSFNDKTDRVIMKFINDRTGEVIREIPPKEMIRLLERMHELIGMFVDESR